MKYYRMIIEKTNPKPGETPERKTYVSTHPGAAPAGWKCVSVCGSYEK